MDFRLVDKIVFKEVYTFKRNYYFPIFYILRLMPDVLYQLQKRSLKFSYLFPYLMLFVMCLLYLLKYVYPALMDFHFTNFISDPQFATGSHSPITGL